MSDVHDVSRRVFWIHFLESVWIVPFTLLVLAGAFMGDAWGAGIIGGSTGVVAAMNSVSLRRRDEIARLKRDLARARAARSPMNRAVGA